MAVRGAASGEALPRLQIGSSTIMASQAGVGSNKVDSVSASRPSRPRGLLAWALGGGQAHQLSVETSLVRHDNGSTSTNFSLVPGQGRHFFEYEGAWFVVERQRERAMIDIKNGAPWETVTLTTLNRDRGLLVRILEEAKGAALAREVGKMIVYTSYGHEWRPFGSPRRRRPIKSVVLDRDIAETILADLRAFQRAGKWYHDRGIPYRRGYLLYGPPGGGKTSFIQALAGELELNICVLNLSERGLTDDRLAHLLANIPARSIILLEDIDAAFPARDSPEDVSAESSPSSLNAGSAAAAAVATSPRAPAIAAAAARAQQIGMGGMLTLSGLLNALDGVAASEERLVFMTTNYPDRLDSALVRPGRVDLRVLIGNASAAQARAMFLRFYNDRDDLAKKFVQILIDAGLIGKVSPAMLQGHFVMYREDPDRAVSEAVRNLRPSWATEIPRINSSQ